MVCHVPDHLLAQPALIFKCIIVHPHLYLPMYSKLPRHLGILKAI